MKTLSILCLLVGATASGCKKKPAETQPATAEEAGDTDPVVDETAIATEDAPPETVHLDLYGSPLPKGAVARLGSLRMLERSLQHMVFSPDGTRLYSTAENGYAVWDATTAQRLYDLPLEDSGAVIAISPNGEIMATSVVGGAVQFWDLEKRTPTGVLPAHKKEITGLCFLTDGTLISAAEDGALVFWRVTEGGTKESQRITGSWQEVTALACGPAGKLILWGTKSGSMYWLDPSDAKWNRGLGRTDKPITAVAISGDGTQVAAASADTNIYTWPRRAEGKVGPPVVIPAHDNTIASLQFANDGRRLFSSGGDRYFRLWDVQSGKLLRDISAIEGLDAQYIALTPDGKRLVSWGKYTVARGSESGRWWLWDIESETLLEEPERHEKAVTAVSISADGLRVATSSLDGSVRIWSVDTGKELNRYIDHGGRVNDVIYAPDGTVWSAGEDARLHIWNPDTGKVRRPLEPIGGEVTTFARSNDGALLATGDRTGRAWLFDVSTGKKLRSEDRKLYEAITAVAFVPGRQELVIAGSQSTMVVSDLKSGLETAKLRPPALSNLAVTFSADGKRMASATSDHAIDLWSTDPWQQETSLQGHDGTVRAVAFSNDGTLLASGGNDQTVRVWDLATGKLIATLEGHGGAVTDVAFTPDGQTLVSSSNDRTGLVWRLRGPRGVLPTQPPSAQAQ